MPLIQAYQGTLHVTGMDLRGEETLFEAKRNVYGLAIGELLDNIVNEALMLVPSIKTHIKENKPAKYDMKSEYWSVSYSAPEVFGANDKYDHGAGSSMDSISDMIRSITHYRHMDIARTFAQANRYMKRHNLEEFKLPHENPFSASYKSTSLEEIVKYGYQGEQLDAFVDRLKEENLFKKILAEERFFSPTPTPLVSSNAKHKIKRIFGFVD